MRVATVRASPRAFRMVVLGDNDIVSKHLFHRGQWEVSSVGALLRKAGRPLLPSFEAKYFGRGGSNETSPSSEPPRDGLGAPVSPGAAERKLFLDIGANLGVYSFIFAGAGWNVVAFEPMARNRRAFEATLCLNPKFRRRVALSETALVSPEEQRDGFACVVRSTNGTINVGNGGLFCRSLAKDFPEFRPQAATAPSPETESPNSSNAAVGAHADFCAPENAALARREPRLCCASAEGGNCERVATETLDAALPPLLARFGATRADVVKVDVEAHECRVLAGGAATLFGGGRATLPDFMQVEVEFGDARVCVADYAARHGYRVASDGIDARLVRTMEDGPRRRALLVLDGDHDEIVVDGLSSSKGRGPPPLEGVVVGLDDLVTR